MNKIPNIFNNSRCLETKYYNLKLTKSKLLIDLLKEKLIGKIKENENLSCIIQKLEDENSVLKDTNTGLIQAAHDTKSTGTETNSLIDNMNRENEKMYTKLENIKKENEKLSQQISGIENEKKELEKYINILKTEYQDFKEETGKKISYMKEKYTELEEDNKKFLMEKDNVTRNKINDVSCKLEEENRRLRSVIDNLEGLNTKYQKDANENIRMVKIFENINSKIDDLKKEVLDKNQILKEEIRLFKNTMEDNYLNVGRIKSNTQEDKLKDNTIKILKESLKIKDKLLSQKSLKNRTVNEDLKDIMDSEFVYGDSLILEDTSKKNDEIKSTKRFKTSDNDNKKSTGMNRSKPVSKKEKDTFIVKEDKNNNKKIVKANNKKSTTDKTYENTEKIVEKTECAKSDVVKNKNDFDTIVKNSKKNIPAKKDASAVSKKQETKSTLWKNENSFFANLSFADTSPVQRKFDK